MTDIDMKQVLISSDPSLLDLDAIVHFLRQSYWATSARTRTSKNRWKALGASEHITTTDRSALLAW